MAFPRQLQIRHANTIKQLNNNIEALRQQIAAQNRQEQAIAAELTALKTQYATAVAERANLVNLDDMLVTCASNGDLERLQAARLLGARLDSRNDKGFDALTLSILNGHEIITEYLKTAGMDFEHTTDGQGQAILERIAHENNPVWMERALSQFPKYDTEAKAMLRAYDCAHTDEIRHMIANTILFQATKQDLTALAEKALTLGANFDAPVNHGMSARQIARYFDRENKGKSACSSKETDTPTYHSLSPMRLFSPQSGASEVAKKEEPTHTNRL